MEPVSNNIQEKEEEKNLERNIRETCLVDVPQDMLGLILSKLFFKDYCNFKLVCKSWNLICPSRVQLPPLIDSSGFHSPCLMIPQKSDCFLEIFHSLYNISYYVEFPELMNTEVLYSKYGWLLVSKDVFTLFFFNPFTSKKIKLPPITKFFLSICFTSPPTSSDCIIFGLSRDMYGGFDFSFIKVGGVEWKSEFYSASEDLVISNCPPVFLNGVFYYLESRFRCILTFNLTKEEPEYIFIEKCSEESIDKEENEEKDGPPIIHESYMVEVDGDIWCVFFTRYERRINIQKLDLFKKCWIKLDNLGDKCLYVSTNGSFAETSNVDGMANKIYVSKFAGLSGIVYSLTSELYYSVGGGFASKYTYGLTEIDYGIWVKPTLGQK